MTDKPNRGGSGGSGFVMTDQKPPQKIICTCNKFTSCDDCLAHDTAIRNAMLDAVGSWMEEYFDTGYDESGRDLGHIREFITSLRGKP
jgi:hypothetical protein